MQLMINEMRYISVTTIHQQLPAYLHIAVQHVQSAVVIHHIMVYKQQKHLVMSQ